MPEQKPVTLEQMLAARENRVGLQREMIAKYSCPLICFTMNMPGEYKRYPLQEAAFDECSRLIVNRLNGMGAQLLHSEDIRESTGCEGFYAVKAEAAALKKTAVELEGKHPLGRLFDIDVFDEYGARLSGSDFGRTERECLVCGKPVWQCARSRAHSAAELAAKAAGLLKGYYDGQFADKVSGLAQRALLYEVTATPKPGLVDRANSGAHSDMDFFTFLDSVSVLGPFFRQCARKGISRNAAPEELLEELRLCGIMAEDVMHRATRGVNTHRGAIFSLGILAAAAGWLYGGGEELTAENLSALCGKIAGGVAQELRQGEKPRSHGTGAYQNYGLTGIRGEAASGFRSVMEYGLPALELAEKSGTGANDACVAAMLSLLGVVDDTNIAHRGGVGALREIQGRIGEKLASTPDIQWQLRFAAQLDGEFIARGISPGGCADLLAVSLMFKFLQD